MNRVGGDGGWGGGCFQAPGFNEKTGWMRFGEIACELEDASRIL